MVAAQNKFETTGSILVAGSLAFDFIMRYAGLFKEHILPERLDSINLSFLTERARKERGGCAGNIANALAMLGEHPRVVATAGGDFEQYRFYLENRGVDTSCIKGCISNSFTVARLDTYNFIHSIHTSYIFF